jgi:hypothetical protein
MTAGNPAQPLTLLRYLQYLADRPEKPAKCGHPEAMGGRTLDCVGGTQSVGEQVCFHVFNLKRLTA